MSNYQVLIIGGGPGGYETAIRLNQYGIDCALVEQRRVGGVCLNVGCIPTKALVKSAELWNEMKEADSFGFTVPSLNLDYSKVFERKEKIVAQLVSGVEFLFRKRKIPVFLEKAVSVARQDNGYLLRTDAGTELGAQYLIIATGSQPRGLPGIQIDEQNILSSTGVLNLQTLPRSLAVVGGGVIGCEFASIMNSFGVQTQIIEFLPRIVALEDEEISRRLTMALKKSGIAIKTGVGVQSVRQAGEEQELLLSDGSVVTAEKVLLSVGRAPVNNLDWKGESPAGERGAISIDNLMRTNLPGVYAIGDVTAKMPLAHTASKQGMIAAEHIRSLIQNTDFHCPGLEYHNIPRCTFTFPEVASVGLSEAEAKEKYTQIKVGKFPFSASGKALAMGNSFGFVKIIAREEDSRLVGMHVIGPHAAELIAQGSILISSGATAEVAENLIFAHPTLSETVKEALEDIRNLSINKI